MGRSFKDWRDENLERERERCRQYRASNKEKVAAYNKEYNMRNKDKKAMLQARRRARSLEATVLKDDELNELVMTEAYALSKEREGQTGVVWNVDHIIPLQGKDVCGLHYYKNIQVITAKANFTKGNNYE